MSRHPLRLCLIPAALLVFLAATAAACNIPVFHYAMENWEPENYHLTVVVRQDGGEKAVMEKLLAERMVNCTWELAEVSGEATPETDPLLKTLRGIPLPGMILQKPPKDGAPSEQSSADPDALAGVVWTGTFSAGAVEKLFASPARTECMRLLKEGVSSVWVLIQSGDAKRDSEALALLEAQAAEFKNTLNLPEGMQSDLDRRSDPPRVDFAVVRVARDDPAEQPFVAQLTDGLTALKQPVVVPLFGRGRMLAQFTGADLSPAALRECAEWLLGPCSCVIKAQNPGRDLLFAGDWSRRADRPLFYRISAPGEIAPMR